MCNVVVAGAVVVVVVVIDHYDNDNDDSRATKHRLGPLAAHSQVQCFTQPAAS